MFIQIRNITKHYRQVCALSNVSLGINRGDTLALIGKSGSGKSTLLRIIGALEAPDKGSVEINGQPYIREGEILGDGVLIRRTIVSVLQGGHLFPSMTALENLIFVGRRVRKLDKKEAKDVAENVAASLGISDVLNRYASEMSGGQTQRVALARALVLNPEVLVLDEITSALDPTTILDVADGLRAIKQMPREFPLTIIIATHYLRFAFEFSSHVAFVDSGSVIEHHPAKEFCDLAKSTNVRHYLNSALSPIC